MMSDGLTAVLRRVEHFMW